MSKLGINNKKNDTNLTGLFYFEGNKFSDERGTFMELYSEKNHLHSNSYSWVQDNVSHSLNKGTLRGLHLQYGTAAQTKLITCLRGSIFDVCVDARKGSNTYGQYQTFSLDEADNNSILIPKGFLHGFVTLSDNTQVFYKVDSPYEQQAEVTVHWNDPDLAINWPIQRTQLIISDKDKDGIKFNQLNLGDPNEASKL